jgi:8-oxo-dGTP pyrophosphatase MutT (NUDIX family)
MPSMTTMTDEKKERWHPSVTVAALIEHEGKYLLVEEHTPEGLKLNQPAGHLDPGESLIQACVRETLEETARHFEPEALVGVYMSRFKRASTGEDITYVRFAFCGSVGEAIAGRALDSGIVRTLWLTPAEIIACQAQHRSPLLLRCLQDHQQGQRYPLNSVWTDSSVLMHHVR